MKKLWITLLTALLFALPLTACGGATKDSMAVAETMAATTAAAAQAANYKSEALMDMEYAEESFETGADAGSGANVLGGSNGVNPVAETGRKLIRTVHLNVETDNFDVLLEKLQAQITALAGYVEQSDVSGNSMQNNRSRRYAYMTVRIPSTSLDQFISSVEAEGNVTNKSESTNDVTLQYSDLESRKKTLSLEQERIWALLEKADTLEAVIALEERLSEIRYELESMESKLRLYDNQVEYSTVHVNIEEVKIYTPTEPESVGQRIQSGLARNIEKTKETCIDVFVWIVTCSPIWIPVLGIVLVVGLLFRRKIAGKKVNKIVSGMNTSFEQKNPFDNSDSSTDKDK